MKHLFFYTYITFLVSVLLVGCTPRYAQRQMQSPVMLTDQFAEQLGKLTYGTHSGISTHYGPNTTVRIGESYYSGLGLICRRVVMTTAAGSHHAAICQQNDAWFLVDSIFEPTAR